MRRTKSKSLGKLFQFWKSLPEARAQQCTRGRYTAPSECSPRPGAGGFLWPRKHVGLRSDRQRKQPKRRAGRRLRELPLARLRPAIFLPGNLALHFADRVFFFRLVFFRPPRPSENPRQLIHLAVSSTEFAHDAADKCLGVAKQH